MKYVLITLSCLFLFGCTVKIEESKDSSCAKVYKTDMTLSFFCKKAYARPDGIKAVNCKKIEYILSEKPIFDNMRNVVLREGIVVPISCDELEE